MALRQHQLPRYRTESRMMVATGGRGLAKEGHKRISGVAETCSALITLGASHATAHMEKFSDPSCKKGVHFTTCKLCLDLKKCNR